ncbi:MAG: DUF2092 domain-containing protein [Thermoanaerobaculia bacterium]
MALIAMTAFAVPAFAAESAAIAPRAEEILRAVTGALASAQNLSFRAELTVDEVAGTGQKLQRGGIVDVLVRRPDRVYAEHDGDRFHRKFVYDGKTMTILDVGPSLYASFDAPPTIDGMLAFARKQFGVMLPLGEVIVAKPVESMLPNIESGLYLGTAKIGGVTCHHLAFTQAAVDWQLWVDEGPKPLLRKLVVNYKTQPQSPQFTALFTQWDLERPLNDEVFKLELPIDASKIDFIVAPGANEVKR